jgi:Fe-S-cluster containining protein
LKGQNGETGARDQVAICTLDCGARCCRYLTVSVPAPRSHADWDEFRWWLSHAGTMLTHDDEDGWMLHVQTRCDHLGPDNLCRIYEARMDACEEYDAATCEFAEDIPFDLALREETDLADHLEQKRLKRGARVARAIREAQRLRPPARPSR